MPKPELEFTPAADVAWTPVSGSACDGLDGSITDQRLGKTFTTGMYACRPPGMPHGPWTSPHGCTTFEVRYRDPTAPGPGGP